MKLDKTTLENKRQQCAEAGKAWKDAVVQTRDASAGKIKPGEGIAQEQFSSALREKQEKAKADYMALAAELNAHDAAVKEDAEISAMETFVNSPSPSDAHFSQTPEGQKPRETNTLSVLERQAMNLESSAEARHDNSRATRNQVDALRNEAKAYNKINLTQKEREVYSRYFGAYLRAQDLETNVDYITAKQEMYSVIPREKLALLTTGNSANLVPDDFVNEVIRDLPGFTNFRRLARVATTSKDKLVWPTIKAASNTRADQGYTSGFAGSFKAQRTTSGGGVALSTQDQPEWGRENIHVHRWEPDTIEVSIETLEDPDAPVESILAELIAETKGMDEDYEFLLGDGNGRPLGLLSDAGIRTVQSGSAAALTYGDAAGATGLTGLWATLPAQYRQNGTFMLNSNTFAAILSLEDGGSTLIFPPNALPNTMFNRPIAFNEFMASVAASSVSVIFGDFRFYIIADRMQLRIMRLVERVAPNIAFLPIARVGGQPVRQNAFKTMTTGT